MTLMLKECFVMIGPGQRRQTVTSVNKIVRHAMRSYNPEFNGDLVCKFKKIIGNPNFFNLLKRIVNRFKRAW